MSKLGKKYISEERFAQYQAADDRFTRREIRREMYKNYLKSDAWKKKRTKVIDRANGICEECAFNHGVDVHHTTYQRLFRESMKDLVLLCRACHTKHHELAGTKYGHSDVFTWTPDMIKSNADKEKKDESKSKKQETQLGLL